jgi:hypothetical protein
MPLVPYATPKLKELQIQIESLPAGEILRFPPADRDMLLAAGILVQTYSYIELNLRRCTDTFAHAGLHLPRLLWGRSFHRLALLSFCLNATIRPSKRLALGNFDFRFEGRATWWKRFHQREDQCRHGSYRAAVSKGTKIFLWGS